MFICIFYLLYLFSSTFCELAAPITLIGLTCSVLDWLCRSTDCICILYICVFVCLCFYVFVFVSCLHLLRWLACHALYPIDRPVGLWLYFGTICTKSSSDCHQDRLYNLYQGDQMVSLIGTSTTNGFLLAIRIVHFGGKFLILHLVHLAVIHAGNDIFVTDEKQQH